MAVKDITDEVSEMRKHMEECQNNSNLLNPFEIGFLLACLRAHKHRDGLEADLQATIQRKLLTMAKYYGAEK